MGKIIRTRYEQNANANKEKILKDAQRNSRVEKYSNWNEKFTGRIQSHIWTGRRKSQQTWKYTPFAFLPPNFPVIKLLIILLRTHRVLPIAFLLLHLRFSLSMTFDCFLKCMYQCEPLSIHASWISSTLDIYLLSFTKF